MGSKGTQSTVQNTNQSYTANPLTQGAAAQAFSGAQSAAAQPFQMPVAPVAGFNPTQQQAFQQYGNLQNSWQPYFNTGAAYTAQSAAPVTAADINSVYNPMADNVTRQLQNIYGQQNVQNQGNLTAQAGGVGADRIAVGMGELANQQGLASGQVYSNLYQQALQTALQEKQLQAGAGGQFQAFGTGSLGNTLQGNQALLGVGNQQQQQTQAELNAPYQNRLAQIAYQFQTPQYLAGITGGLAPALGGTTLGNQTTTAPQPSILSQILGIGTAGAGIYGALGGFGGSPSYGGGSAFSGDAYGGSTANPLPNLSGADYGVGYADGGATDEGPALPGMSIPKGGGTSEPIPLISLRPGPGHSGPLTGGIQFSQPQSGQQQSNSGSEISGALGAAAKLLPFFMADGGATGSWEDETPFSDRFNAAFPNMSQSHGATGSWDEPPGPIVRPGSVADKVIQYFNPPAPAPEENPTPVPAGTVPLPKAYPGPGKLGDDHPDAFRLNPAGKPKKPSDDDEETPAKPSGPMTITSAPPAAVGNAMMPTSMKPYPDALDRDVGQQFARSPWLSLVQAGATIASTPGPIGATIGKGLLAGTASLEDQRKQLRSEQELNDKAQELYEKSMEHLDKYNRMTPFEAGSLAARNREIDQSAETGGTKSIDVQRYYKGLNESTDESVMKLSTSQKYMLAAHMAAHGGSMLGAEIPFDVNGKSVTGVFDGRQWKPKTQ